MLRDTFYDKRWHDLARICSEGLGSLAQNRQNNVIIIFEILFVCIHRPWVMT